MLYALDIGNDDPLVFAGEIMDDLKLKGERREFAEELFKGAKEHLAEIDAKITAKLTAGWSLERLGMVERAILRLAVYEILFTDMDNPVVINEAVELTKNLADDKAPKLINGVLEAIRKEAQ